MKSGCFICFNHCCIPALRTCPLHYTSQLILVEQIASISVCKLPLLILDCSFSSQQPEGFFKNLYQTLSFFYLKSFPQWFPIAVRVKFMFLIMDSQILHHLSLPTTTPHLLLFLFTILHPHFSSFVPWTHQVCSHVKAFPLTDLSPNQVSSFSTLLTFRAG